jgi:hypothetical protein
MQLCACEALDIAVAWTTLSEFAQTPLYFYSLVLVADGVLYFFIMLGVVNLVQHGSAIRRISVLKDMLSYTRLTITSLCKEYTVQDNLSIVLSDIKGEIKTGDVTVVLGNNGAGMSD